MSAVDPRGGAVPRIHSLVAPHFPTIPITLGPVVRRGGGIGRRPSGGLYGAPGERFRGRTDPGRPQRMPGRPHCPLRALSSVFSPPIAGRDALVSQRGGAATLLALPTPRPPTAYRTRPSMGSGARDSSSADTRMFTRSNVVSKSLMSMGLREIRASSNRWGNPLAIHWPG